MLQQIERLRDEFGDYTGGLRGHVRLFSNTNAREFLPEALSPFLIANPGIQIDVEERLSYEIVRARKLPESGFQTRRGGSKVIAQAALAALRRVRGSEVVQHIQRPRRRLCRVGPKGLGY